MQATESKEVSGPETAGNGQGDKGGIKRWEVYEGKHAVFCVADTSIHQILHSFVPTTAVLHHGSP